MNEIALTHETALRYGVRFPGIPVHTPQQLVSAGLPLPLLWRSHRECHCTPGQIQQYLGKISGPLLSRTVADLGHSPAVSAKHVAEAVQYRSLDRNYWT